MVFSEQQNRAFEIFQKQKRLYLAWEVGSGKTYFIANTIMRLKKRAHIIVPRGVFASFGEEFQKAGCKVNKHVFFIDSRIKKMRFERGLYNHALAVVMSYECFRSSAYDFRLGLKPPELIAFDEGHKIKDPKSEQGKKARRLVDKFKDVIEYRILASGTPTGNTYADLWNQMYALDNGKRLGDNFYKFLATYFKDDNMHRAGTQGYYPKRSLKAEMKDILTKAVADVMSYSRDSEKIKLPSYERKVYKFQMADMQKQVYDKMVEEGTAILQSVDNESISVRWTHTLAILSKLRQISSGFLQYDVPITDKGETKYERKLVTFPTFKDSYFLELMKFLKIGSRPEKVIVWCEFRQDYIRVAKLLERLGLKFTQLIGNLSAREFVKRVESFQSKPEIKVAIVNPKSGGAGLNLQVAKYSIWYSFGYSYIDSVQAKGRNFRRGSSDLHEKVTHFQLITKGTVEESAVASVRGKAAIAKAFKSYILNYDARQG